MRIGELKEGINEFKVGDNVSYTDFLTHFRGVGTIVSKGFNHWGKIVRVLDVWGYEQTALEDTLIKNETLADPRGKRP